MKILGINASPRGSKSQTRKLIQAVLDGARSQGATVELVDLSRLKIEYCICLRNLLRNRQVRKKG